MDVSQPESVQDLRKVLDATILTMAALAEPGDSGQHLLRMKNYVRVLAHKMQTNEAHKIVLSERYIAALCSAAPLHDIGNAGVPDRILLKPGPLTEEELEIVKTHPQVGRNAIEEIQRTAGVDMDVLDLAKEIAYAHQERWDGSGYPLGLAGEAIPLSARLMAIADTYDGLTTRRVYRDGVPHDVAVKHIFQQRGTHFAPDVVDAFMEVQNDFMGIAQRHVDTEIDLQNKIDYMAKAIAESP
ncbi:MAG: HD domain-containing phosphohydrolase [Burkholderiaceae bacterium]